MNLPFTLTLSLIEKYGEIKYEEMGYVRKIDWEGEKRGKREREGRPHPCQSRRKVPAIGSIL